jgi:hypothetical protein
MDIVTNAMPAYFSNMSEASMALVGALATPGAPQSYGSIFRKIDPAQVAVVTGEEDNVFHARYRPRSTWSGFHQAGAVDKDQQIPFVTEVLPAGTYTFAMTPEGVGGDADLYLRVGATPTATATYKCRSYLYNSNERCQITLVAPAKVHMIAEGDKPGVRSRFRIDGFAN